MKRVLVVLLGLLVGLVYFTSAQKPALVTSTEEGWQKIGEITASFKMQDESIVVLGADEFSAIKLKVTDAPIHIERLQVFYESGEMEEIDVRSELQAGTATRVINLSHPDRDIQKVAFTYKTLPNYKGEKAHVELHGYKPADQDDDSDRYRDEKKDEKVDEDVEAVEEDVDKAVKETEDDMEEAENEISEAAGNVAADIKDKVYADKVGPKGQTIYIDKHARFYYINDAGKKVYVLKTQLKDKPKKD